MNKRSEQPISQQENFETEKENEKQIRKKQEQYYAQKKARKIDMLKQKQLQFGQSSSDEEQEGYKQKQIKAQIQPLEIKLMASEKKIEQQGKKFNINIKNSRNDWKKGEIEFLQQQITLSGVNQNIKDLVSIKAYLQGKSQDHQFHIQLIYKRQSETSEIILGIGNQMIQKLPLHFYIFAKIVSYKIMSMKVQFIEMPFPKMQIPEKIIFNSDIYGNLFKKSQFLGNWSERTIVINIQGLFSYKQLNQKPSMHILWKTVKQISTSFEIFQNNKIVVKVSYGSETCFALPIIKFEDALLKNNWLFCIYKRSVKLLKG